MHLICLKAFANFHRETLFKNTLFYGNKLYVVEFSQKESRANDSVNARFDTKKEGKATLFPLFFYSLQD